MTGLFIDINEFIPDAIEEEVNKAIRLIGIPIEEYTIIPSKSNKEGWDKMGRPNKDSAKVMCR